MKVFERVMQLLSERSAVTGTSIIVGKERIPIDAKFFRHLDQVIGPKLVFVDGGNGELLRGPNVSVQFIRLYAGFFEKNIRYKRLLKERIVAVFLREATFEARVFELEGQEVSRFSFDVFDPAIAVPGRRAEAYTVGSHVRKLLELEFATELVAELNAGDILVRDGDLDAFGAEQQLSVLKSSAEKKGITLAGVSKTTTLCTDAGNAAVVVLQRMAPNGCWVYDASSVKFAHFHPSSKYIFRCDVFGDSSRALSALSANSSDPALLGYPYGLIDADKFAQVPKEETAQLRMRFAIQSKEIFSNVERSVDAHDILNVL